MADSDLHTVTFTPPTQQESMGVNPPMLSPGGTSGESPGSLGEPGSLPGGTESGPGGELSGPGGLPSGPGGETSGPESGPGGLPSGPGGEPVETTSAAMEELMQYATPSAYIIGVEYKNPATNPGPRLEEVVIKFNTELATNPILKAVVNGALIEKVKHIFHF